MSNVLYTSFYLPDPRRHEGCITRLRCARRGTEACGQTARVVTRSVGIRPMKVSGSAFSATAKSDSFA